MEKRRKVRGDDPKLNTRKRGKNERTLNMDDGQTWFWQSSYSGFKLRSPEGKSFIITCQELYGELYNPDAVFPITPYDVKEFIQNNPDRCS